MHRHSRRPVARTAGGFVAHFPRTTRIWSLVAVMLVALTLAACGTGAPSVHRDTTPTPASTGAISAPTVQTSGAVIPSASSPTVAAMTSTAPPAREVAQAIDPTVEPTTAPEPTSAASTDPTPRPDAPVP